MLKKISLLNHISHSVAPKLHKLCKPLFTNTCITYFCYLRRYRNGQFTFMPTAMDAGRYLFEDAVYPDSWFAGIPFDDLVSGYSFWDLAKQVSSNETQNVAYEFSHSLKLSAGIEIIEKNKEYCDFYSFSGNNANIYYVSIKYLYKFIYYFRQECHKLLLEAYNDRLTLKNREAALSPIPIVGVEHCRENSSNNDFNIKRYYLSGQYSDVFLTKREVNILTGLKQGKSSKILAESLCISPRTIENHLANIKEKLNLSNVIEVLDIATKHKLIS